MISNNSKIAFLVKQAERKNSIIRQDKRLAKTKNISSRNFVIIAMECG